MNPITEAFKENNQFMVQNCIRSKRNYKESNKQEDTYQKLMAFLKLKNNGCRSRQAIKYTQMKNCRIDATQEYHGTVSHRILKQNFDIENLNAGWQLNKQRLFNLGKFYSGVKNGIIENQSFQTNLFENIEKAQEKLTDDFVYRLKFGKKYFKKLNSDYSLKNLKFEEKKEKIKQFQQKMNLKDKQYLSFIKGPCQDLQLFEILDYQDFNKSKQNYSLIDELHCFQKLDEASYEIRYNSEFFKQMSNASSESDLLEQEDEVKNNNFKSQNHASQTVINDSSRSLSIKKNGKNSLNQQISSPSKNSTRFAEQKPFQQQQQQLQQQNSKHSKTIIAPFIGHDKQTNNQSIKRGETQNFQSLQMTNKNSQIFNFISSNIDTNQKQNNTPKIQVNETASAIIILPLPCHRQANKNLKSNSNIGQINLKKASIPDINIDQDKSPKTLQKQQQQLNNNQKKATQLRELLQKSESIPLNPIVQLPKTQNLQNLQKEQIDKLYQGRSSILGTQPLVLPMEQNNNINNSNTSEINQQQSGFKIKNIQNSQSSKHKQSYVLDTDISSDLSVFCQKNINDNYKKLINMTSYQRKQQLQQIPENNINKIVKTIEFERNKINQKKLNKLLQKQKYKTQFPQKHYKSAYKPHDLDLSTDHKQENTTIESSVELNLKSSKQINDD